MKKVDIFIIQIQKIEKDYNVLKYYVNIFKKFLQNINYIRGWVKKAINIFLFIKMFIKLSVFFFQNKLFV